jgi:hypothetical protein
MADVDVSLLDVGEVKEKLFTMLSVVDPVVARSVSRIVERLEIAAEERGRIAAVRQVMEMVQRPRCEKGITV